MNSYITDLINNYIQSFIYAFETSYDSSHEVINDVIVFHYGQEFISSPFEVVPYHSIVFSQNKSPEETHNAIKSYPFKGNGSYAIYKFHEDMNPQNLKIRYEQLGYEYFLPNILQMVSLPVEIESSEVQIQNVSDSKDVELINTAFKNFKPFPNRLIGKKGINAIYAVVDQKVASWSYLVQCSKTTAYIGGMFTLPDYRRRGIATAMLNRVHDLAHSIGVNRIILVPSFMAWKFYTQRGYETVVHFSTFIPSGNENSDSSIT